MNETIFFNVWRTGSPASQAALLAEMRGEAAALAAKPGFLGLTVWASEDGRVLVKGRWASRAYFEAAVEAPEMKEARSRLERFGKSEPGLFTASFEVGPVSQDASIPSADAVTFVQIWEVGDAEHQKGWLDTMRRNVGALTGKPGFEFLRTHASDDGKRVAVYAHWRDRASLEAAVSTPEARAGHQKLRAHGAPNGAIYKLVDEFLPDPTDSLREEASKRWALRGFTTDMIRVNGVDLHVASGGTGSPLVLLHGYPQSGEIWRFAGPEFVKTHRVIIPDLRGMGLSGIVSDGFDLPNAADDMHELMEKIGVQGAVAVGHDWGGAIGAVWALKYRGDIRKFAFIESAVGGAGFERIWTFDRPNPAMTFIPLLLTDTLAESLIVGREGIFLHHLWSTFTHNKNRIPFDAWQPYVDAMKRPGLIRSSAGFYREVYGAAERIQQLIAAGKLTQPVLSISGQASFGEAQKPFVEAFATNIVKHVTVANCGHFVAEEQPEALSSELHGFLAT